MKKADIGVALYLLAAVIFFIVPISSNLLDVMLALNISIALIVLFNTLFVKEVLDMSFFSDFTFVYDNLSNFLERVFNTTDLNNRVIRVMSYRHLDSSSVVEI